MSWRRGQAYAQDLRDRVLAATGRLWEVAARFGVSQSYVSRARARCDRLGQKSPGAQCNHVPLRLAALKEALLAQVAREPEQTRAELCQWIQAEHGIKVGPTTMGKTLARFGLTLKKRPSMPANSAAPRLRKRVPPGAPNKPR
jgi:transposase